MDIELSEETKKRVVLVTGTIVVFYLVILNFNSILTLIGQIVNGIIQNILDLIYREMDAIAAGLYDVALLIMVGFSGLYTIKVSHLTMKLIKSQRSISYDKKSRRAKDDITGEYRKHSDYITYKFFENVFPIFIEPLIVFPSITFLLNAFLNLTKGEFLSIIFYWIIQLVLTLAIILSWFSSEGMSTKQIFNGIKDRLSSKSP